jgi:hypothetical protein
VGGSFFRTPIFAVCAILAAPAVMAAQPAILSPGFDLAVRPTVRRKKAAAKAIPARYRSRGTQAKPRKRPNRMHISKRVRRKHRRAA